MVFSAPRSLSLTLFFSFFKSFRNQNCLKRRGEIFQSGFVFLRCVPHLPWLRCKIVTVGLCSPAWVRSRAELAREWPVRLPPTTLPSPSSRGAAGPGGAPPPFPLRPGGGR